MMDQDEAIWLTGLILEAIGSLDDGPCLTVEVENNLNQWVQVLFEHNDDDGSLQGFTLNFPYRENTGDPLETLARAGLSLPPDTRTVEWEDGGFASIWVRPDAPVVALALFGKAQWFLLLAAVGTPSFLLLLLLASRARLTAEYTAEGKAQRVQHDQNSARFKHLDGVIAQRDADRKRLTEEVAQLAGVERRLATAEHALEGAREAAQQLGSPVGEQVAAGHLAAEQEGEGDRRVIVAAGDGGSHVHHHHEGRPDHERRLGVAGGDHETDGHHEEEGPDEFGEVA